MADEMDGTGPRHRLGVYRTHQLPSQRRSDFQQNTSNPASRARASPGSRIPHKSTCIHRLHRVSATLSRPLGSRALTFGILNPGNQVTSSERAYDFVDAPITQTGDLDDEGGRHDFVVLGPNFNL